MYRILNSGLEFLFGILLETSEATRDCSMQNTMRRYCTDLFSSKNANISMEMRAIIAQVRAQAKVPNFSHKPTQ